MANFDVVTMRIRSRVNGVIYTVYYKTLTIYVARYMLICMHGGQSAQYMKYIPSLSKYPQHSLTLN